MWNQRSASRLEGIDPRLRQILELARQRSGIPFEISEGFRDANRQQELFNAGKSQTLNSRHLHGNATDIFIPDGKGGVNWDFEAYRPIAEAAKAAAAELGYDDFAWGGDWKTLKDGVHFQVGGNPRARRTTRKNMGLRIQPNGAPSQPEPEQRKGLLGGIFGDKFEDEDKYALAMALSGMSMRPNQGLQAALQMKMKNAQSARVKNKTVNWLTQNGREDLAQAVESGAIDGRTAATLFYQKPDKARVFPMGDRLVDETGRVVADFSNPQVQLDKDELSNLNAISDDARKDLEPYELARSGFENIQAFYKDGSKVSDYALAVGFAKILDPGSVVRENEVAAVAQNATIDAALKQQVLAALDSKSGSLPPEVRDSIARLATELYNQKFGPATETLDKYKERARMGGLPEEQVYMGQEPYFYEGQKSGGTVRPQARPGTQQPPSAGTQQPPSAGGYSTEQIDAAVKRLTNYDYKYLETLPNAKAKLDFLKQRGLLK